MTALRTRFMSAVLTSAALGLLIGACGGSAPTSPPTPVPPTNPPNSDPPANVSPTIQTMTVQGRRSKEPAGFADLRETVDVTANVSDPETPLEELTYEWTAPAGTFNGTGRSVTWRAPDGAATPMKVTLTLKVTEKYGHPGQPKNFSWEVTKTVDVSLHDSIKEVGDMSRQFLLDFSNTNNKDANQIMRNFGAGNRCPDPGEVSSERDDVIDNYTNYSVTAFSVGPAATTINFGGFCPIVNTRGDACAVIAVMWDSIRVKDGSRSTTRGDDIISAAYSTADSRWWLCSSRYHPTSSFGAYRFIR